MYMHTYIETLSRAVSDLVAISWGVIRRYILNPTVCILPLFCASSAELLLQHTGSTNSSSFIKPLTTMRVTLCTADGSTAEVEVALETDISTIKLLAEIELGLMNPDSLQVSHNGSIIAGNPTLQAVGVGDHDLLMLAVPEPAAAAAAAPAVSAHSFRLPYNSRRLFSAIAALLHARMLLHHGNFAKRQASSMS
jgi:hypothetical protein